jgi:uncharacterized protein YbjT (DUF2867 family)
MKVTVTGATGFIGRQVITALQNTDVKIVAPDSYLKRVR